MSKSLTLNKIALRNITRRYARSLFLGGLVALLAFVLTGGSLLVSSLRSGTESMAARLGADALIVPAGYERSAEGALLRGEPSSFYLEPDLAERLSQVEGIAQVSPQLFIASMNSEHCDAIVQFIGFDPDTDFVVKPWLSQLLSGGLPKGQIVIGSRIDGKPGQELNFFGRKYTVAAKLEETGMGFDTSVFTDLETSRIALADYISFGGENAPPDADGVASVLTVNIRQGYDSNQFSRNVNYGFRKEGVGVVFPKTMISNVSGNLASLIGVTVALMVLLWVLAAGVLTVLFSVTVNERKREFGVYRALGAPQRYLSRLILTESLAVSAAGAVIGTALITLVYFLFSDLIGLSIDAPYLRPAGGVTALVITGGFALSLVIGPLAAAYSAGKIGRIATYAIMREGE
ncbi:MAG: ABC transporter permease [Oscillospiraceae bacterium]|jgi:putative ABC transport system permease protein|nr:ABC transporter permease [Oscillospiraceae bacterium]